jgi:hypothetical protein
MLDSMIPDVLASDAALVSALKKLIAAGQVEILLTHIQGGELVATPDLETRRSLLNPLFRIGARSVPTTAIVRMR